MRPTNRLRRRVAVITRSTRGIGLFMAAALAQAGADVVISSRSMDAVESAYARFADIPGVDVLGVECDVREVAQVRTLAQRTLDRFGRLDVWINNIDVDVPYARSGEIPPERWRAVVERTLFGTYHGTIVALEHMQRQDAGKIINLVGVGADDNRHTEYEFMSAYAAANAAIRRFTRATAAEYRHTNVSILGFDPGTVRTDRTTPLEPLTDEAAERLEEFERTLDRRATSPEDVGEIIVELASGETGGVTGEIYRLRPGIVTRIRGWITEKSSESVSDV